MRPSTRTSSSVLREAATERPWSGALLDEHRDGLFRCRACDAALFRSTAKFESGSGWPSFFEPVSADAVELEDGQGVGHGPHRGAVRALRIAPGAPVRRRPADPAGDRYCMNSVAPELRRVRERLIAPRPSWIRRSASRISVSMKHPPETRPTLRTAGPSRACEAARSSIARGSKINRWSRESESNRRHPHYKGGALPIEHRRRRTQSMKDGRHLLVTRGAARYS